MGVNYKALELKLRRIVEKRLGEGYNVAPGQSWSFSTGSGKCCALGAADPDRKNDISSRRDVEHYARILGIGFDEALALSDGFENQFISDRERAVPEMRDIGNRIRRIYCDDNGQVE